MNRATILTTCLALTANASLISYDTEHIMTETKRVTIENERFEMRRESKNGVFSETYSINDEPVTFDTYKEAFLNAQQSQLAKEMEAERQQALAQATLEKEARRTASARFLKLSYDELKALAKNIKNYELEPHLNWNKATIKSREDYEYATNQLLKEVDDLIARPEITDTERDLYNEKLRDYTHRLTDLFHTTVNTLINTTKDTKLLKRLMDIV